MKNLVLAIHPASRGFGWIVLEGPCAPLDWGAVFSEKGRNLVALARAKALLERHRPHVLILESFERPASLRRARTRRLCRDIVRAANQLGIALCVVSRTEIHGVLGASMRKAVAIRVAEKLPQLSARLPKPQPIWVGESLNMALFCAGACALTFYASLNEP